MNIQDHDVRKQLDELVSLNQKLLNQNEEVKQENADLRKIKDELTHQLAAEGRLAALRTENAELRKRLAAANTGHVSPSTTSAYDQLAELARERATHEGVTFEKAFSTVTIERPELYEQHRAEMRGS